MLEWIVFFVTLVVLYNWLNIKPNNFPPVPIFGSLPFIKKQNFHLFLEQIRPKYGPVIGLMIGSQPAVAVCGAKQVLEVFKRDEFSGRPDLFIKNRNATGVMFSNGDHWKFQRRFTLRRLRDFGFGKTSVADMIAAEVEELCEKKLKGVKNIPVSVFFNTSAVNILWAMLGGKGLSYDDKDFKILLTNLQRFFRKGNINGGIINGLPLLEKILSNFYEFDVHRVDRMLQDFFKRAIEDHRATKTDTPRDFLDVYINELENPHIHDSFKEATLLEVCRDFFTAGVESSSNTVSFAILYLIRYPEWQNKLIEEIDQTLGGRTPSYEDRLRLPLVEAFLSEVQRNNTISPMSVPHATIRDTNLSGYFLPNNTLVHLSIWSLLQDKNHWGDPEVFRPERFLSPEGTFVKDPYMILFGAGPRMCAGESLARQFVFLFFVSLVQRYKFLLPNGEPMPKTLCRPGFTTAPQTFNVDLEARF